MKILSEQVRVIAESRRFCMMMLMWTTVSLTFASATVDHRLSRDQGKCQLMSVLSGVARICCEEGKEGNYVTGHSRWTSGPGAAAAR